MLLSRESLVCLVGSVHTSSQRARTLEEARARTSVTFAHSGIARPSVNGPYTQASGAVGVGLARQADAAIFACGSSRGAAQRNERARPAYHRWTGLSHSRERLRRPRAFASAGLALAAALALASSSFAAIDITGPGQIALPSVTVTDRPQTVYSGDYTLTLRNNNAKDGWILSGEVVNNAMQGIRSSEKIGAELVFKSITWASGGQGSAAGLRVHADGKRIEADPGFGRGIYRIAFEIRFEVPAFPIADEYVGVSSFIVQ